MKNIYEILADCGLEVPQDKKEAFDNSVKENYKTVSEVSKITSATFGADVPSEFEENIKNVLLRSRTGYVCRLTGQLRQDERKCRHICLISNVLYKQCVN